MATSNLSVYRKNSKHDENFYNMVSAKQVLDMHVRRGGGGVGGAMLTSGTQIMLVLFLFC